MREDSSGRGEMPLWRVSQRVHGASDNWPGSVVSVDHDAQTFDVRWEDGMYPITYPMDTAMVIKGEAWPWE